MTHTHELILRFKKLVETGTVYEVLYQGEVLIASKDPEFAACRELVKRGITGKAVTRWSEDGIPCMYLDIEGAAKLATQDISKGALCIRQYREPTFVKLNAALSADASTIQIMTSNETEF
jgi:hypothetical protein